MVTKLKKKFIRIAMISVTVVLVLFGVIINVANYISVDSQLDKIMSVICDNKGRIPDDIAFRPTGGENESAPDGSRPPQKDNGASPFGKFPRETAYSTRYFTLYYDASGSLDRADLENIASVTDDNVDVYLAAALKKDASSGYVNGFKFKVIKTEENKRMAVFLDCQNELRSLKSIALLSVISMAVCILGVYIAVRIFSGRAVDPVVQSTLRQKQFITDASHELKTPITVIGTSLSVLEMETGKQKWIDKARAQTEKLTRLVNSLVALSRMDEENPHLNRENFDISAAAEETAESFRDFAKSAGHELIFNCDSGIMFNGDEYSIRQLISILLDNAVKYSSENSDITMSLKRTKKGVIITQTNACAPIENDELDKLFDRFYRADKSRSSGNGFGIGLSMAKCIAESHKGSIKASAPAPDSIEFTVVLKN